MASSRGRCANFQMCRRSASPSCATANRSSCAANERTGFYIASSTKSYVALVAAILAQHGVVDLDAPIVHYLPELKLPPEVDPQRLTLRALLTHTSGLENDPIGLRTAYTGEQTPSQIVALLATSKPMEPKFKYTNLGYVVAGVVLERVTGKPWQQLVDEEIVQPLGMRDTTSRISGTAALATPHSVDDDARSHPIPMLKTDATMHAAGGLVTTPRDLARWLEANVNDGRVGERQLLPAAAFREAHRRQVSLDANWYRFHRTGYGLGWYLSDYDGAPLVHQLGSFEGWYAHVSFMPEQRFGVAVVANTSGPASMAVDLIAASIYDRLLGKPERAGETARVKAEVSNLTARIRADAEKRRARPSTLAHPPDAYAGAYANDRYGTLTIRREGSALRASIGLLDAALEPFTEPESVRAELIPGAADVLRFVFGSGGNADAVRWRGEVFKRSPR
jgi:CubicO group peptidase (beta-lactamase class C family)